MLILLKPDGVYANNWALVIKIALLICLSSGIARSEENLENKIKTAYLYNFTKFITWPKTDNATFNICLLGEDPFQSLLDSLESKMAADKPIKVFRYTEIKQIKNCQILYFSHPDAHLGIFLANTLVVGSLKSSLTVSSQPFFAEQGGMIGFVLEQEKVRLHINLKALKKSGLEISAKLIEVSTIIEGGGDE